MNSSDFTDDEAPAIMMGFSFLMIMVSIMAFLAAALVIILYLIYVYHIPPPGISSTPWNNYL